MISHLFIDLVVFGIVFLMIKITAIVLNTVDINISLHSFEIFDFSTTHLYTLYF